MKYCEHKHDKLSSGGIIYKDESWYKDLQEEDKYVVELIIKYHDYFKKKDKKHKKTVQFLKVSIMVLAMSSTIVLGLRDVLCEIYQLNIGLILSAIITCFTAVSSFFNFERYWMRNISIHIELNILRDNFIYEAKAKKIDNSRSNYYLKKLEEIQQNNIKYWKVALKKL
jgi:hypothetical protein